MQGLQTHTSDQPLRVFISYRHKEAAAEADLLRQALRCKGFAVRRSPSAQGHDLGKEQYGSSPSPAAAAAAARSLQESDAVVVIGTKQYGKRTLDPFTTHDELRYIMRTRRPFFLIRRCTSFKYHATSFWLDSNREPAYTWLPADGGAHPRTLPPQLLVGLLAYLRHIQKTRRPAVLPPGGQIPLQLSTPSRASSLDVPDELNVNVESTRRSAPWPSRLRRQQARQRHYRNEPTSSQDRREQGHWHKQSPRSVTPASHRHTQPEVREPPTTTPHVTQAQAMSRTTSSSSLPQRVGRSNKKEHTSTAGRPRTSLPELPSGPTPQRMNIQEGRGTGSITALGEARAEQQRHVTPKTLAPRPESAQAMSEGPRPSMPPQRQPLRRGSSMSLATCTSTASTSTAAAVDEVVGHMEELPSDVDVQECGCMALQMSIDRDGAFTERCLSVVLHILCMPRAPAGLHAAALGVLMTAATGDKSAGALLEKAHVVETVVESMQQQSDNACVQLLGCEFLRFVTQRQQDVAMPNGNGDEEEKQEVRQKMKGEAERKRGRGAVEGEEDGEGKRRQRQQQPEHFGDHREVNNNNNSSSSSSSSGTLCLGEESASAKISTTPTSNMTTRAHGRSECTCDDPRLRVACRGGLRVVIAAMAAHPADKPVQLTACEVLDNAARAGGRARRTAAADGALARLVAMLEVHADDADMQRSSCTALLHLTGGSTRRQLQLVEAGGVEAVVAVLRQHQNCTSAVLAALAALDVLLARGSQMCSPSPHRSIEVESGARGPCGKHGTRADNQQPQQRAKGTLLRGAEQLINTTKEGVVTVMCRVHAAGALAATVTTMELWPARISVQMGGLNVLHKLLVTRALFQRCVARIKGARTEAGASDGEEGEWEGGVIQEVKGPRGEMEQEGQLDDGSVKEVKDNQANGCGVCQTVHGCRECVTGKRRSNDSGDDSSSSSSGERAESSDDDACAFCSEVVHDMGGRSAEDARVMAAVASTLDAFATHAPVVKRARRVLRCFTEQR